VKRFKEVGSTPRAPFGRAARGLAPEDDEGGRANAPSVAGRSDTQAVQTAAVRLLARREHSSEELKRKLVAKGHPADTVDAVVTALCSKHLVSDDRFVASFVHHHASRGQGPVRIRAELRQHGIADGAIDEAVRTTEPDWTRLAGQVRARKFGSGRPATLAERAKQARFLQYRGFTAEQIRTAFQSADSGEEQDGSGLDMDF
jgi:regulatory protein